MEENDDSASIYDKLEKIKKEITKSFNDDKTEYLKQLIKILKEILTKNSIEEYFNNNTTLFNYFSENFLKDSILMLLRQEKVHGENGDEIALEVFLNIIQLFLKFHKKDNYSAIFQRIHDIFLINKPFFFGHNYGDDKGHDLNSFNSEYCSEFQKELKKFEIGDEIDFPYHNEKARYEFLNNVWLRGKIKDIRENNYLINFCEDENKYLNINYLNIFPKGKKTLDWDWRLSLKKYDVIDCFDRNKWYPATILSVKEKEINGYKRIKYKITFRLYTEHFSNPYDESDSYENHIDIWKTYNRVDINTDEEGEKYVGDGSNCDEDIVFYSKRIQKFGTYSTLQQRYPEFSYSFNTNEDNELKRVNDSLANDTETDVEDNYLYEKDGKKNYILGKYENQFYYPYAQFLKIIEKNKGYDKLIEILKDNPNTEEIYHTFFLLYRSFPFLHSGYFLEYGETIKSSCINYINNLDSKNIRKIPKELNELVKSLMYQISIYFYKEESENNDIDIYDEIILAFAMKSIKTNIFDYRLKGIKDLNDIIEKNKNNDGIMTKIIKLIKENKILSELFGANYHSQLIKISNEIIKLLLKENELDETDMTLIWSCTKRGDLEAKLTIMKLLSSLAKNLKENHIEMLLNSVISNVDKKINNEEIDLVFNLSTQNEQNEKNMMHCCEYLSQIFFVLYPQSPSMDENAKKILEKILLICPKNDKYLQKVLNICENGLEKNVNSIQCYIILQAILNFYSLKVISGETQNEVITKFTKDNHIINLFENNLKIYLTKAKEILEKNKIPLTEVETISKYIIDDFSHNDNIKKRLEILPFLINEYYPDYDFLPFLKNILVINSVSSNDQLIFYDFIKNFISDKNNTKKISEENKKKLRQEIFELISKDEKGQINLEQLNLFIAIFLDINKDNLILEDNSENEIKEVIDINELIGLDKLWNIIYKIDDEKVLSFGIKIIYQIYKDNNIEKLFKKCSSFINDENIKTNDKLIEKYVSLMKLIIIESEKNILFTPKSHLSLLKNCLINLPFEIKGKEVKIHEDIDKFIILGNTNLIDAKILISKIYEIPYHLIQFSLTKNFLKLLKKNNKEDLTLDESYNNISFYELIIQNDKDCNLLPKDKIKFSAKKPEEEKLLIDGEINPKLRKIFQEWFIQFTQGTMKMDVEGTIRFISGVTPGKSPVTFNESRVKNFLKEDLENRGYVNEEEFIHFFEKAIKDPRKSSNVWSNLSNMGIGRDLKKEIEKIENLNFYENEKLPRYKLGNDLNFVKNLIQKYYENPEKYFHLIEFLFFLTTNEKVYNDVLENLFNEEDNDTDNKEINESFFLKAFKEKNKYVELNYIFIIIESILQDFEISNINNKNSGQNDFINSGNENYKFVFSNFEPYDDGEKIEKKFDFVKRIIKSENFQKIINHVNDSLENLLNSTQAKNSSFVNSKIYDYCLRGIKLLNTINNFCSIKDEKENSETNIKQTGVYYLGFTNLAQFFKEYDFQKEFENLSYKNLANNLIKILTKTPSNNSEAKENEEDINEKENNLKKECIDLLIKILSTNKQLLENYKGENDSPKKEVIKLFIDKFTENNSKNKEIFIKSIIISVKNAEKNQNVNYIEFLSKLVNNLLDNLINPENQTESQKDKNQFTPDNSFFELYNNLHKFKIEENKNTLNESALKIYELIIKNIENSTYQNKLFLSLLHLLNLQISSNEEIKEDILFKEQKDGKNLFNFLFQHAMPELLTLEEDKKEEEKEELISSETDMNSDNIDYSKEKFILLENIKEEKKDESNDNLTEELSQICNEFLLNCFNNTSNPKIISQLLNIIYLQRKYDKKNNKSRNHLYQNNKQNKAFELASKEASSNTKKFGHVGLKNLGCICYMNSIMQQMYFVPTFRNAIMSADDHKEPKDPSDFYEISDDNLLHQLQKMYTYLTYSNKSYFAPRDFCYSYKDFNGNPTNVRMQQDSQEFYNNFCDKIENCLKITKFKYIVSDVFMGQSCSSVECSNCKNLSNRFEDFYNLTLEVKNINHLNDSLQKMSVPEIIDDFKCSKCNQKVTISKITSLNKLPNVLVVHLKRFYLNYEIFKTMKINSKFEFPKKLNLKQFCVCEIQKNNTENKNNDEIYIHSDEYYEYELKGINVHTGSADGGHYFSFIDVNREGKYNKINTYPKEYWLQFNDSKVSEFDTETIPKECYGGNYEGYAFENIKNAYLLIYERKIKTPIRVLYEKNEIEIE